MNRQRDVYLVHQLTVQHPAAPESGLSATFHGNPGRAADAERQPEERGVTTLLTDWITAESMGELESAEQVKGLRVQLANVPAELLTWLGGEWCTGPVRLTTWMPLRDSSFMEYVEDHEAYKNFDIDGAWERSEFLLTAARLEAEPNALANDGGAVTLTLTGRAAGLPDRPDYVLRNRRIVLNGEDGGLPPLFAESIQQYVDRSPVQVTDADGMVMGYVPPTPMVTLEQPCEHEPPCES